MNAYQKLQFIDYMRLHQDYRTRKNVLYMNRAVCKCVSANFMFHLKHPYYVPYRENNNYFYTEESARTESGMWP